MSLSRDLAVKDRSIEEQSSHPPLPRAAPASLPGALPASRQGCPSHVSLTNRRHPSWANHVTNPTATWATTSVFPAVTLMLWLVPGAPGGPALGYLGKKDAWLSHGWKELPAPCKTVTGYRLGLSYLSCSALTALWLSVGGREQECAMVWSCPCPDIWL